MKMNKQAVASFLIVLGMVLLGVGLTGNAIKSAGDGDVVRAPLVEDTELELTTVELSVYSKESSIAIVEDLVSDDASLDCFVLYMEDVNGLDLFVWDDYTPSWVLGNNSNSFFVTIKYYVPYGCYPSENSKYFYVDGGSTVIPIIDKPSSNATTTTGGSTGGSSGGGGGGGSSSSSGATSSGGGGGSASVGGEKTVQAETNEDYNSFRALALNLIDIEGKKVNYTVLYTIVSFTGAGIIILVVLIFFLVRGPKESFEPHHKAPGFTKAEHEVAVEKKEGKLKEIVEKTTGEDINPVVYDYLKMYGHKYALDALRKKVIDSGHSGKDFDLAAKKLGLIKGDIRNP